MKRYCDYLMDSPFFRPFQPALTLATASWRFLLRVNRRRCCRLLSVLFAIGIGTETVVKSEPARPLPAGGRERPKFVTLLRHGNRGARAGGRGRWLTRHITTTLRLLHIRPSVCPSLQSVRSFVPFSALLPHFFLLSRPKASKEGV